MKKEELQSLPKYAVIRSLLDSTLSFTEVMRTYDTHTCECDLGPEILAMVYRCRQGHYHIVTSPSLSPEGKQQILFHELKHIIEDMPKLGYIIGVDMQYETLERKADMMVREVAAVEVMHLWLSKFINKIEKATQPSVVLTCFTLQNYRKEV